MSGVTDERGSGVGVGVRCAARVRGVRPYAPPAKLAGVDLVLDANEGVRPGERVLGALGGLEGELVRRYPDASALEARIGERFGLGGERVVVTNGGDEAIDRVCRAFLEEGRVYVTHTPTFVMLPRYARLSGAEVRAVRWLDGAFPLDELLGAIDERTGVVSVVTPTNPTGREVGIGAIEALGEATARVGAVLLVDLAYAEFSDEDMTERLLGMGNVVVVRTFSKAYGMAGLRIGCALCGSVEIAGWMRAAAGPYPVSAGAIAAAGAVLDDPSGMEASVARVKGERAELSGVLRDAGVGVFESGANFVACRFGSVAGARFVHGALLTLGVSVRWFGAESGIGDVLRVTLPGDAGEFERLCRALRVVLEPEALLLDMDGVLADVSGSYRRAIVETAQSFGVDAGNADVSRKKREGGWNDDWELTRSLVLEGGVEASFEEVVERFQRVYEGEGGVGGVRETERSLVDRTVLERAAARGVKLGVVTGRPKGEAAWFIERAGLGGLFGAVVTMGDTERGKPDPSPVERAMGLLGVERAWMVGDTVDDVRAARAALGGGAVLGVGVVAPEDEGAVVAEAMGGFGGHLVMGVGEAIGDDAGFGGGVGGVVCALEEVTR